MALNLPFQAVKTFRDELKAKGDFPDSIWEIAGARFLQR